VEDKALAGCSGAAMVLEAVESGSCLEGTGEVRRDSGGFLTGSPELADEDSPNRQFQRKTRADVNVHRHWKHGCGHTGMHERALVSHGLKYHRVARDYSTHGM